MSTYRHIATKTTFILSDSRRTRLKTIALSRGTTVTALLAEGADLVLEKYERAADKQVLLERARKAREELRNGLFEGPAVSHRVDELVYGFGPEKGPAKRGTDRKA